MAYSLRFTHTARKQLSKLDRPVQVRLIAFAEEIAAARDPRARGAALTGAWGGFWKFRSGDYRLIAEILDRELVIEVVKVGHRREIYR